MNFASRKSLLFVTTLAALASLLPSEAEACGGFFCDAGPTVMPVDQTGETIVFWIDETGPEPFTEAHIQIQYEGEAEQFAWIIPVTAVPEVLVGSQALFDNLLQATVPLFVVQNSSIGDCGFGGLGCVNADLALQGGRIETADEGGNDTDGPDILDRGFAGAFEYVTLTGDSVDEVVSWLEMAGYAQDPEAPPILAEYLQEGFAFVAVKLRSGADVEEIHPLAIRYAGIEPCIPIRLTRIAAVEDMAIRAMFLGDARVAPQNWSHVVINHSRLDFASQQPSLSYPEIVSLAIDEAGGRAFVSEYAGTDAVVPTSGIHDSAWSAAAFTDIEVTSVVDELALQKLLDCTSGCSFAHPQVEVLLETYLPPPPSVDAHEFWACLSCYEGLIDLEAWDPAAFATALDERIVEPGQHALDMLVDAEYLTRLYTVISPHEMIEDPLFHETTGLDNLDNTIASTVVFDCDGGPSIVELPDGRNVALTDGGLMPDLELPAAERIEQVPAMGPPQVEVDNGPAIDAAIAAYNDSRLSGPEPSCAVRSLRRGGGFEGLFTIFAIFGIAGLHRARRRRT